MMASPFVGIASTLLIFLGIAYFCAPAALRLLAQRNGKILTGPEITSARASAMIIGVALTLISALLVQYNLRLIHAIGNGVLVAVLSSILTGVPYAPLFVAFALIVRGATVPALPQEVCDSDLRIEPTS